MRQVMKTGFALMMMLYVLNAHAQQQPFATPTIWLRADSVGQSNQWNDVSGNGYSAFVANGVFAPSEGLFNFQPCLVFDSLSEALWIDYRPKSSSDLIVFAVFKPTDASMEGGIWSLRLDTALQIGLSSQHLRHFERLIRYNDSTSTLPAINLLKLSWINNEVDTSVSHLRMVGTDSLSFKGKFAEFMLYDSSLKYIEIEKIHTYLAIKYGISIEDLNYVSSLDTILWNYDDNQTFSHEIAGIGCDTTLQINQKQSCGKGGESALTISAGLVRSTNEENVSTIEEQDFLIWGHNGKELLAFCPDTMDTTYVPGVSECRWMMKRTGQTAQEINTALVIHAPGFTGVGNMNLIINRNCDFTFPVQTSIIIPSDSMDTLGNYYFMGVYWDTDESGSDAFGFQMLEAGMLPDRSLEAPSDGDSLANGEGGESVFSLIEVYPNPSDGRYFIHIKLVEELEVQLSIQDEQGKIVEKGLLQGAKEYSVNGWLTANGCYMVKIEAKGEIKTVKIIVQ